VRARFEETETKDEESSHMKLKNVFCVALLAAGSLAYGAKDPIVGGAAMYPTRDIVDNAVNSKDHTTLVAAVKAAGLVDTLKGPGPFTVFAPNVDS
jgi:uncharacterized surface protein with fasciclin (FAS1) repeats